MAEKEYEALCALKGEYIMQEYYEDEMNRKLDKERIKAEDSEYRSDLPKKTRAELEAEQDLKNALAYHKGINNFLDALTGSFPSPTDKRK